MKKYKHYIIVQGEALPTAGDTTTAVVTAKLSGTISDRVSKTDLSHIVSICCFLFSSRLEEVDQTHNQQESVCSEQFQIESLKHLDLSHSMYLPQNVVFCFRLEEVDLRHNQLESVCSELFQIESLKQLDLSHICLKMLFSVLG